MIGASDGFAVSPSAVGIGVAARDGAQGAPPVGHPLFWLLARALLVGFACFLSTETVASNLPPLFVSPVWPTNSILLCAMLVTPVRHWWAYALAGFVSSVNHNAHTAAPVFQILVFLLADAIEVVGTALGVRRFAGGLGAFENPRNLVAYLIVVGVAPLVSACVAALAASPGAYWTLWRSWFLTDTFGYLTLAPAILTWLSFPRAMPWSESRARNIEAGLLGAGLLLTIVRVFISPTGIETNAPALMYLPLPFLLWAAVRFGPRGATTSLAIVTLLAMSGALRGHGPFGSGTPADNVLSLQLFLITISPSLMFVAVLVEEQKRSQKALRRSEARYRAIVEDQTELICRFRPDGTYTFVNGAICRGLHLSVEDLVGRSFWDFVPAEDHGATQQYLSSITAERPVASREQEVVAPPGRNVRWQHWTTRAFFDDQGVVTEYQAVGRDITERKRAEDERQQLDSQRQIEKVLRASEERFRSLADNAPVLIWMSGLRNEAVYFNKPWLDFTGRPLEEELGFGWLELIHPDDRQACVATCDEAFTRREPLAMQFRLRRRDGEYRWILDNGIPYFGADGTFNGYVGSCVDITPRKLAEEELEQAGRRKDEFLAMLGHELRNPLAPIGMAVELMRSSEPTDDSIAWARDLIDRQLGRLTRLVDDLLDVSRITRGEITLLSRPVELASVVTQAVEISRPLIQSRSHRLAIHVPTDPVRVRGDAVRLGQVLSNLLNNAAKYTPDGGCIELTVERRQSQAIVTVADNGLGLRADMLERVFDLFSQFESRDHAHGGLGIGLTLVKRLVELHGGHVEARSAGRGQGSEFIVRLPALEVRAEPEPVTVSTSAPSRPRLVRRRILVVDDNIDAADALSRILELHNQDVHVAHDGHAALQMARAMQPEIVFLDLALPKMNGLEVARRLRNEQPGRPMLLVAVTGFGQEEDRRRTADAGFDHHLVKPIDPQMLRSLLSARGLSGSPGAG
jgi:PAS domain S-box-containing protein